MRILADIKGLTGSIANGFRVEVCGVPGPGMRGTGALSFAVWEYPGIGAARQLESLCAPIGILLSAKSLAVLTPACKSCVTPLVAPFSCGGIVEMCEIATDFEASLSFLDECEQTRSFRALATARAAETILNPCAIEFAVF